MGNLVFKKKEFRLLMVGLDAAGKTTVLYKLKLGEVVTTIPTIGFNVESVLHKNISLNMWDIGMRSKSRPLLRHYYPNTQAIILVIDSHDRDRIKEVKYELDQTLAEDELRDTPMLVLCNKQDLAGCMSVPEITEQLELYKVNRQCGLFATCATTGEGLYESLDWLTDTLLGVETNEEKIHSTTDYWWKGWQAFKQMFSV